ncbi:MAG: acyltransferase [Candidatus Delongbacteria bacterium]|nr:acyltransferase [Candidatus Delongbacteria bacterium]MBN2834246.1 acyltransferase [Candidatus Delongbacteria bacterium]
MRRIANIQSMRGIAVILVVVFHMITIERRYGGINYLIPDLFNIGMFGVDLFFVISGFVMVTISRGKFNNIRLAFQFLYNRISRIYPTYWIYSLIILIIFLFKPSMVNSSQGNEVNIVSSFMLFPSDKLPLIMVGWTLIHEIYFYFIYFIILLFYRERSVTKAMLVWASIIILAGTLFDFMNPFLKLIFHPLTIEFISGCLLAVLFYNKKNILLKNVFLIIISFTFLILLLYAHNFYKIYSGNIEPQNWNRVLIFGVPAFVFVFCSIFAEKNRFVFPIFLEKIGDASYSIYLSHILSINICGKFWIYFSYDSLIDNIIMIPLTLLFTIMVGFFSYKYIEKPLLHKTKLKFAMT